MIKGSQNSEQSRHTTTLSREGLVRLLRAAIESNEYRFAQRAALAWLAAFPGDIEVALLQARALMAEGRTGQAIPILEQLHCKDPLSLEISRVLVQACLGIDQSRYKRALTINFVLDTPEVSQASLEEWGIPLRAAWHALAKRQFSEARWLVEETFHLEPDPQLTAAVHLLSLRPAQELHTILRLAQAYHKKWPECLPAMLVLAEANLSLGNEPEAVRLLHLSVSNDTTGQVARRLWGVNHPYRSLWPGDDGIHPMVIHFDLPVPAGVAARLGWNRLGPGEQRPVDLLPHKAMSSEITAALSAEAQVEDNSPVVEGGDPVVAQQAGSGLDGDEEKKEPDEQSPLKALPGEGFDQPGSDSLPPASRRDRRSPRKGAGSSLAGKVEREFNRLAKSLKQPELVQADGRFPVYVILSSREGLVGQYGPQTASVIDEELRRLAGQVRKRRGWTASIYYPDDAECTSRYGLTPVNPRAAWKIKHALMDLDDALAKRGEMIGALLIVGGDSVIPFHRLPNPTDDPDGEVFSDSPYATRDANYFVPEWPVGRLPGEAGPDAGLLLDEIRETQRYHSERGKGKLLIGKDWLVWIRGSLGRLIPTNPKPSFGYTAAVWRRSSLAVFRPIGAPHTVLASPPIASGTIKPRQILGASLGYYNLHGLEDSPAWYGQRDPFEPGIYPDYPVALSPADLHKNGRAPRFIFSEACYGGLIHGKKESDSLALKFLAMGSLGVVASTCMAYGSLNTPLIAADLLGNLFWQHLKAGRSAGEALMRAKVDLVKEMNRRQGYLDGEDQKTLISFTLYGDPLAAYDGFPRRGKGVSRVKDHPTVRVVSDIEADGPEIARMPAKTLDQVKAVVTEYLPGADLAGMRFCRLQANGAGLEAGQAKNRSKTDPGETGRVVVTVNKQVQFAQHIHRHYLRVTLDENGRAVKMALSR